PRGVPQIEVTFDIDANGIVHVSAKDLATGKEQSIKITASSGLSKEEVDRLIKEAEAHAEEDRKKRELIDLRNQADNLIYTTEKNLSEFGDKIPEDEKTKIQGAISELRKAMEGSDGEAIRTAMQNLTTVSHKLAEEMYKKASAESATGTSGGERSAPGNGSSTGSEEKVVDAEFEEVDKEKKS
ncbi:MAG: molecular chaperone DnaK, partial [Nitrospirae bacterium]